MSSHEFMARWWGWLSEPAWVQRGNFSFRVRSQPETQVRSESEPHLLRFPALTRRAALTIALFFATLAHAGTKVGDVFPALDSAGLVPLSAAATPATKGQITLVDFWASWCAPCKASFPAMAKLHADYGQRGFAIVAVGIDEKPESAVAFWKKMAVPFAGVHDREQKLVKQVVVPTMPTSYLLDRSGKVRFVHEGFRGDSSVRELRRQIELLLAEKP